MKTCSRCGVIQSEINFSRRAASPGGLCSACKICESRDNKAQRARLRARSDEEIEAAAAARPPRACRTCKQVKTYDEYPRDRGRKDGRGTLCLVCAAEATRNYTAAAGPDKMRRRRAAEFGRNRVTYRNQKLRQNFGITLEQYDAMLAQQNGLCAICRKPETATRNGRLIDLAVDHDHVTGGVRKLLCTNCNKGLGFLQDSPELLTLAALYVSSHRAEASVPPE